MSLRRRIAVAAAIAVAAVALALGVTGYLSTRSHLVAQLRSQLRGRAALVQQHGSGQGGLAGQGFPRHPSGSRPRRRPRVPSAPPFGGAPGYFQFVHPDGSVFVGDGGAPQLPVDARVLAVARGQKGAYFSDPTIGSTHVEVLTTPDTASRVAIEVGLPLTGVDSVLRGLLLTDGLLVAGGVLLAALLGWAIARSALAPIDAFSSRTELVTRELDEPHRLAEEGAPELRRLAASFNRTLEALERAIAAQRNLIADASHELRTPMAALRSNIQIFLDAGRLPAGEREDLQRAILSELDDLTQLVADVVDLARGTQPRQRTEAVELDAVVQEAVARARRRAPSLRFSTALEPTVVVNAPDRVARAVANLVDNACKFSPEGAEVEIVLRDGELSVRDHGPGFQEADLPHVFDRFYRAAAARRTPGSGLGLAIVKQAAEAFGGSAHAANAPGGGALLRVSFGSAAYAVPGPDPAPARSA